MHLSAIGVAATETVRANRMESAPLGDMVKMNKEKGGSLDVVTGYCHREKRRVNIEQQNIINQYNMPIGGDDGMDQNISAYMINLRSKKWWWPLFQLVVDVAVNNSYQIYRQSHLNPRECRLDALGFRRAIVDAHYRLYRKSLPSTTLFTDSRSLHPPANNLQFDGINHLIAKDS